jgi:hypothetical protein
MPRLAADRCRAGGAIHPEAPLTRSSASCVTRLGPTAPNTASGTGACGIPLAVILTGGNRNDVIPLIPLLEAIPKIRGTRGRPAQRPRRVYGDPAMTTTSTAARSAPSASPR